MKTKNFSRQINQSDKTLQLGRDFRIRHYAGEVTYVVAGFIEKNKDNLFQDFKRLLFGRSAWVWFIFGRRWSLNKGLVTCYIGEVSDWSIWEVERCYEDEKPKAKGSGSQLDNILRWWNGVHIEWCVTWHLIQVVEWRSHWMVCYMTLDSGLLMFVHDEWLLIKSLGQIWLLSNGSIAKESCNWKSVVLRQMMPLKVWLHTARSCNHQSFACPSDIFYVWLLWYPNFWPWSREWRLTSALRQQSSLMYYLKSPNLIFTWSDRET